MGYSISSYSVAIREAKPILSAEIKKMHSVWVNITKGFKLIYTVRHSGLINANLLRICKPGCMYIKS